jgi:hypothetical protein
MFTPTPTPHPVHIVLTDPNPDFGQTPGKGVPRGELGENRGTTGVPEEKSSF